MPQKISLLALLILTCNTSYAMLCPGNFNQINPGDSIAVVEQKCGKPEKQTVSVTQPNVPQEWNYFLKLAPTDPATIKTSVAFAGGRVINISVNNVGITNTGICGSTIQVGDTEDTVRAACGKPAFIAQNNGPVSEVQQTEAPAKNIDYTYPSGMGNTTLHFENGVLTGASSSK